MEKLIITVALTGAQHGKEANPNLPEQPEEIIRQAIECREAGAAIVHIHARDREGKPTADPGVFKVISDGIMAKTDLVICLSTGGAAKISLKERIGMIPALKPELASFNIGTTMTGRYDFENGKWLSDFTLSQSYSDLELIARTMLEAGTKPEIEIYDPGMINNALLFEKIGAIVKPMHFSFVMGIPGQINTPTPKHLLYLSENLPEGSTWQVIGIGIHQFPMVTMGMLLGGHVRVGMEDNLYISRGVMAESNAQFVEKTDRIAREIGRPIATPDEAREILGLKKKLILTQVDRL
ncbi:MAG: 3-keto-5-aminohexanoate cleavage protein [Thermodesulfobacteriota bacterium]|jgi:3-keto-5-aminohexanoate cleavage enzyme|nr:3-keto-5-aminohexanoate cleavage protein [Thermodesulfobacteriota bacterium]